MEKNYRTEQLERSAQNGHIFDGGGGSCSCGDIPILNGRYGEMWCGGSFLIAFLGVNGWYTWEDRETVFQSRVEPDPLKDL